MQNGVKWTIAIPTVPARRKIRERIITQIEQQITEYNDIELLILEDNRKRALGDKRQALATIAQGEYLSFIDDDDLISDNYVSKIYPLLDGVDCVGIDAHISLEGQDWELVEYRLHNPIQNRKDKYVRPIQHLTPVKTEIVKAVGYKGHRYEDSDWAERASKVMTTTHVAEGILYYYFATNRQGRSGVWR